jgi:transcriptional regulatory protein LevR
MTSDLTADAVAHAQITEEFADRLEMLEESGQVSKLARRLTELALADLAVDLDLRFTEENSAQFVTHLAIALTRINRGDPPIELSAVAEEEIAERTRERDAVARVMRDCAPVLERTVPDPEISYMTVHLCSIVDLQSEQGG